MKTRLLVHQATFACLALLACLTSQLTAAQDGDPLDRWHQLNPDADLYDVVAAQFGNGRWVAITGYPGYILSSLDGTNWVRTYSNQGINQGMESLQFSGSRWIALASEGTLVTPDDGLVWNLLPDVHFGRISYGNDRWVAFRYGSQIEPPALFWSTNGIAWQKAASTFDVASLAFGSGQWLALGFVGGVAGLIASNDGEHWTPRKLPEGMDRVRSLAYGNGLWLIQSSACEQPPGCINLLWKSLDGKTWEKVIHGGDRLDGVWFAPASDGGVWFGKSDGRVCTSMNLIHWACAPTSTQWQVFDGGTVWVGGRWLSSSTWSNHEVFTSSNGLDWTSSTAAIPSRAIGYGQGKWLGLNNQGKLLASDNGRQWTTAKIFPADERPSDVAFADGLWVLGGTVGTNLLLLTSTDGQTWSQATIAGQAPDQSDNYYLGHLWPTSEGWKALTSSTWLLRSQDGRNWSWSRIDDIRDYGLPYNDPSFPGGVFGAGITRLEIVSDGLRVGIVRPFPGAEAISRSRIVTSIDGTNWTTRYDGPGITDYTVANGRLIVVSEYGSVLESDPLLSLQQKRPGELSVRRAAGLPVVVESSDDLRQWHTLTNLPLGGPIEAVTDPADANSAARFYRARTR